MVNEIQTIDNNLPQVNQTSDPMLSMIDRVCSDPNFDIAKMERLIEMRNQDMARKAALEFSADFAKMQCELPEIKEKTQGHNYKYAAFEDVMREVKPVLKEYGFAVSFGITQHEKAVIITASLMHKSGHREQTSITLPHETSGSKNAVQAVGSTILYGKRYTILSLLSIATCGEDTDGNMPSDMITEEQIKKLKELIFKTDVDIARFCGHFKIKSLQEMPTSRYFAALGMLVSKTIV